MEKKYDIKISQSDNAVSFYIILNNTIAISELTTISDIAEDYADLAKDKQLFLDEIKNSDKVYYFNRLNVPKKLRGQGLGELLLQKTLQFCDDNNAMLINTVNPYGDMNLQQLNNFYEKAGMKLVNEDGLLIYSKNIKKDVKKNIKSFRI